MSQPVKLYVYDLSNGLARQLSMQLTGRQINGIWHTSVVVFGKEVFYGQGISITAPGRSHHGTPLEVIDMGETALDEETFDEYLAEMREHYTADKYHLLDFNCNSFTNDCVGFLTGGSIPAHISDLPADFLSTPFGAALRPTIDNMFRRPAPGTPAQAPAPQATPALASSLLQSVASQATAYPTPAPTPPSASTATLAAPLHFASNAASFHSILGAHRAVVANFSQAGCAPCAQLAPVYEELAREKARAGVAFVKVEMHVGRGGEVAAEYGVRAAPTVIFFLDGKKISEMKGANIPELRSQVDLLLFQAFPPHPHASLNLKATRSLSLAPILSRQIPNFGPMKAKLTEFVEASPSSWAMATSLTCMTRRVIPWLKERFEDKAPPKAPLQPEFVRAFAGSTETLAAHLGARELFPLADAWRLAMLDAGFAALCTQTLREPAGLATVLKAFLSKSVDAPRAYALTLLRFIGNALTPQLARILHSPGALRDDLTGMVVRSLLSPEGTVRVGAATAAFNVAAAVQRAREDGADEGGEAQGDWEVEIISAIVEALQQENESEEVVHRLTAALALVLYRSPSYESSLSPLLEVLQTRNMLREKAANGPVKKKDVKALMEEVSSKLCPS